MASNVKELADREAQRAEAEEPDPDAPDEGDAGDDAEEEAASVEPTPAPPVEPPAGQIGPEEIAKAEKAIAAHRKKMGTILGAESVAQQCFVCAGMGFLPELPQVGATFKVVEDGGDVLLVTESPDPEVPLKPALDKAACSECDGLGQVLSGSRNPKTRVVGCGLCQGNGWVTVPRDYEAPGAVTPTFDFTANAPTNGEGQGTEDAWGRAAGHKHWGVPPNAIQG